MSFNSCPTDEHFTLIRSPKYLFFFQLPLEKYAHTLKKISRRILIKSHLIQGKKNRATKFSKTYRVHTAENITYFHFNTLLQHANAFRTIFFFLSL